MYHHLPGFEFCFLCDDSDHQPKHVAMNWYHLYVFVCICKLLVLSRMNYVSLHGMDNVEKLLNIFVSFRAHRRAMCYTYEDRLSAANWLLLCQSCRDWQHVSTENFEAIIRPVIITRNRTADRLSITSSYLLCHLFYFSK